ncbi:reverse transcriptase domain-containing protein [Tanacetum coccineum]|uniref:Reverse transcriptase domain-containing protein n=1 Tax=Tanacetum coccineum TaxID=301880 RepID=A0ABQ5BI05_9ASTR
MTSITSAWPFSQWRIDIVRPLPMAPGGTRFLVVAIDYFTKWVKAKPLVSTTGKHMEKFVWEHIVCRFGIPQIIISNNGKQFAKGIFPVLYQKLGKMGPTWEGSYIVKKAYEDGAYKLETLSGSPVDQTWNGSNLWNLLKCSKLSVHTCDDVNLSTL